MEVGWCGFPSIAPDDLCFFEGHISSYLAKEGSYLVDGVAINGVSGGPAFFPVDKQNEPIVCGVLSGYIPNITEGKSLPGVCYIRSVEAFRSLIKEYKSIDDKNRIKNMKLIEKEQKKEKPQIKKKTKKKKKTKTKKHPQKKT